MADRFDFCVLGAGLAGVSVADELIRRNKRVCLVDPCEIAGGASGAPLGLVNPATGRYATKTWRAEECLNSVQEKLEEVQQTTDVQFFKQSGVLRPALDKKISARMQDNLAETTWPEGWVEWKNEAEIRDMHPGLQCVDGGVWLPVGMTVNIGKYLETYVDMLVQRGLSTQVGTEFSLDEAKDSWQLQFDDSEVHINADQLIFTSGIYTDRYDFWKKIMLHPVKGQLAVMESENPISFDHAVSALGYTSSLSETEYIIGSTYEHEFEDEEPDKQGLDYLLSRFEKVLPELKKQSKVKSQWSGVRASTPNRKPVLGTHSEHGSLHLFAGLGSKGLLYSCYGAHLLVNHILDDSPLPESLGVNRFY